MPFTIHCQTDYIYLTCATSQGPGKCCMVCPREILRLCQILNDCGFNVSQKAYEE